MQIRELAELIKGILENKKGIDVELIDVRDKTTLADYFVIASGSNITQVKALADEVEYKLDKEHDIHPDHIEGSQRTNWILLDYLDVVVHVFLDEERSRYSLEKLWSADSGLRPSSED